MLAFEKLKKPVCLAALVAATLLLAGTASTQTVSGGDITIQMDGSGSITDVTVSGRLLPKGMQAGGVFIRDLTGSAIPGNILFEESFEDPAHGWEYHKHTLTQELEFENTNTQAHGGSQSLLVRVLQADEIQRGRIISPADNLIPVVAGKRYRIQCYCRALRGYLSANPGSLKTQRGLYDQVEAFFHNGIGVYWLDAGGETIGEHQLVAPFMDQADAWKPVGGIAEAPENAVHARVAINASLDPEYELESFVVDRIEFFEDPSTLDKVSGVLYPSGSNELSFIGFLGPWDVRMTWTGLADSIEFSGTVSATDGASHALDLIVSLPLDAEDWTWPDDAEQDRTIRAADGKWYANEVSADSQSNLPVSLYPYGGTYDDQTGLAACIPYDPVYLASFGCDTVRKSFDVCFRIGVDPTNGHGTEAFSARYYTFDPEFAFRSIIDNFSRIWSHNPHWFHSEFDPSPFKGWFSHDYQGRTGASRCAYCDENDILAAQYTVPDFLVKEVALIGVDPPPTLTEVYALIEQRKNSSDPLESYYYNYVYQEIMRSPNNDHVLKSVTEESDTPLWLEAAFKINPDMTQGADGYVDYITNHDLIPAFESTMNPDPSWYVEPSILDAVFLDNFLNQNTVDCDPAHIAATSHGLTYTASDYSVGMTPAAGARDYTAWLRDWLDANVDPPKRWIMINWWGVAINSAIMPWCDGFSDESNNAVSNGAYGQARTINFDPEILRYKRALAGQKYRMQEFNGTDLDRDDVLDTLHTYVLYAMGGVPDTEAEFEDPGVFDMDDCLELTEQYNAYTSELHMAGWQPLTYSTCSHPDIYIERYGSHTNEYFFLVVLNDGADPVSADIILHDELGLLARPIVHEVVSDERYWPVRMGPAQWSVDLLELRQRRAHLFLIINRN